MNGKTKLLRDITDEFEEISKNPECFLNSDVQLHKKLRNNLKRTYDLSKREEIKSIQSNALPTLIIKNFDLEQIWQQIELQNDSVLTRSLTSVSKILVNKENLLFKNLEEKYMEINDNEEHNKENVKESNANESDEEEDDDNPSNSDNMDIHNDISDEENQTKSQFNKPNKKSVVDDEFFKLSEMEAFLNAEEKKLDDPDSGNDSEESGSDEEGSVDMFKDMSDEEDPVKTAKYKDFFVQKEEEKKPTKRNKFLEEFDSDEDDDDDEENGEAPKSSLELRQERLQKKIQELEENAISEKPWQLKGEITAESRPQNSLLEEIVEFDMTSRPAPVMTEQTSLQLEDIIRQRIKDKAFDSVERKAKPVDTPLEYKKKLVLDQEKSKESLAQIYEKEYLEQQAALDPNNADKPEEEPELHKEIKSLMGKLFNKLDALSNFHFTPKPAVPELKIISNLPAINMEEVAPVAVSDGALLAPEEVKNKTKGEILGKSERTKTDMKRERRKKKLKQKHHAQEKEKRESKTNTSNRGFSNKRNQQNAETLIKKSRNINKMDESTGSKSLKSSSAFFTQLQDEVQTHITNKVNKTKKNTDSKTISSKIKL